MLGGVRRCHRDDFRLPALRILKGKLEIIPRSQRDHAEAIRVGFDDLERRAADRAGGAEDGNAGHAAFSKRFRVAKVNSSIATGDAKRRASIRSRMPPCPGRMLPESFTPAPRLSIDSTKSPTCAETFKRMENSANS